MTWSQTNGQRTQLRIWSTNYSTPAFSTDRYFDVFVEYAKESPEDILIRICVAQSGAGTAMLHLLPTLWFRNHWSSDGLIDRDG